MTPEESNLRCLEGSVKNLIAALSRHDGSILRDAHKSDGTISGDLYAIVASIVGNRWDNDTLSDLQRRYPLPKPIDAAQAGDDGRGELPGVRGEVPDGGGSAECGGVRREADVEPPVTARAAGTTYNTWRDAAVAECGGGPTISTDMKKRSRVVQERIGCVNVEPGSSIYNRPRWLVDALEQARSTTRRNILQALDFLNNKLPEKWDIPEQDIAVAMVALRQSIKAEHAGDHKASVMERFAFDKMREAQDQLNRRELELRGAIKGRDNRIKKLQDEVNQLARHIALQVAK